MAIIHASEYIYFLYNNSTKILHNFIKLLFIGSSLFATNGPYTTNDYFLTSRSRSYAEGEGFITILKYLSDLLTQ